MAANTINYNQDKKEHELVRERLIHVWNNVFDNIEKQQEKQKQLYDQTAKNTMFKVDDLVRVYTLIQRIGKNKKFERNWLGPYKVIKVTPTNLQIKYSEGSTIWVHKNRCKIHIERNSEFTSNNSETNIRKLRTRDIPIR